MKIVSVSGIVRPVEDLSKTIEFYEKLGFLFKEKNPDFAKAYVNWFWIEFVDVQKMEATVFKKQVSEDGRLGSSGDFLHVSVDDVDEFYEHVVSKGLKPSSEPQDFPWGRREFVIRDPDGYKLVFFKKK